MTNKRLPLINMSLHTPIVCLSVSLRKETGCEFPSNSVPNTIAFVQRGGERARKFVKRNFAINGALTEHPFSLAIANGKPLVAAEVFSFVASSERSQEKDVMATAFAFEDIQRRYGGLDLAALVLTGEGVSPIFEDAKRLWIGVREAGPPIHVQEARR